MGHHQLLESVLVLGIEQYIHLTESAGELPPEFMLTRAHTTCAPVFREKYSCLSLSGEKSAKLVSR